jgi:hypothetical protein
VEFAEYERIMKTIRGRRFARAFDLPDMLRRVLCLLEQRWNESTTEGKTQLRVETNECGSLSQVGGERIGCARESVLLKDGPIAAERSPIPV